MNKLNINKKTLRGLLSVCAVAALAAAMLLTTAGVASADYGQGALYQIELSSGDNGTNHGQGGGFWWWIALYPDGTGDYAGSDCLEQGGRFRLHGAYPDLGDVTWAHTGGCTLGGVGYADCITISGLLVEGLSAAFGTDIYVTITVPSLYGHYTGSIGTFLTFPDFFGQPPPGEGTSVLEVAP